MTELEQGLLVQTPDHQVLKVSTVYDTGVTAQLVYPLPGRTTVREYTVGQVATWRDPSPQMLASYERAWGLA